MGLECNACEDAGMWLTYDTREEIEAFLTAHSREMEDWENNHWGICLHLNNPTPTGAAFYWGCDQLPEGVQARAGEHFYIERWEGEEWAFPAPLEGKDWNWDEYSSYNFVNETVDWTDVYGVLPGGRYRISKYIDVQYNGKTRENLKASAEFSIISGSGELSCDYVLDMYQRDMNISWDSFSDFSYVDLPDPRYQMVHRYFDLEGPLAISINGPSMDQRPNSVVLFCENEPDTVVLLHHRLSWQAVQRFMEVHSQPLAESQTSHWGIDMAVTDFTPTGATLAFTRRPPRTSASSPATAIF